MPIKHLSANNKTGTCNSSFKATKQINVITSRSGIHYAAA